MRMPFSNMSSTEVVHHFKQQEMTRKPRHLLWHKARLIKQEGGQLTQAVKTLSLLIVRLQSIKMVGNLCTQIVCRCCVSEGLYSLSGKFSYRKISIRCDEYNNSEICAQCKRRHHYQCDHHYESLVVIISPPKLPFKSRYRAYRSHDVIKWKHFQRYWPFVRGIHRSPVNSPHKDQWRPSFDIFFDLCLNKRLSKQSWAWWFETPTPSLWRHCNETTWDIKRHWV